MIFTQYGNPGLSDVIAQQPQSSQSESALLLYTELIADLLSRSVITAIVFVIDYKTVYTYFLCRKEKCKPIAIVFAFFILIFLSSVMTT